MNILLTNSAIPDISPYGTERMPPLGIGFLISVLRNEGHKVFFIDNCLTQSDFLETDYLIKNKIDYVGISTLTPCYRTTLQMLSKLQKMREEGRWKGKIILGGPHTSVGLETIPEFIDYIVQGEGERAFIDILNGKAERIVRAKRIENLDSLPMLAWDYFISMPYDFTQGWTKEKPVFPMSTSRGCPFNCTFCSSSRIWGRRYTYFSAERIINDIQCLMKEYGARGFYFREDNFTVNRKRVVNFCDLILSKGLKFEWGCETRVDSLDHELINLMHRTGCRYFYLGVESGSQRVLNLLNKGITIEQSKQVFKQCRKIGIYTYASFMVRVPGETEEERVETIYFSEKIRPNTRGIYIFMGVPGSEIYDSLSKNNLVEYKDASGLIYLKGHDQLVDQVYGGNVRAKCAPLAHKSTQKEGDKQKCPEKITAGVSMLQLKYPWYMFGKRYKLSRYYFFSGRRQLGEGNLAEARQYFINSIRRFPFKIEVWIFYFATFLGKWIIKRKRLAGFYGYMKGMGVCKALIYSINILYNERIKGRLRVRSENNHSKKN